MKIDEHGNAVATQASTVGSTAPLGPGEGNSSF
jgi:hypothetical protein